MTDVTITEPDDTFDALSNGLIHRPCAGCGVDIPCGRKWCSEQCRDRHRQRDTPSDRELLRDAQDVWTFAAVVAELVEAGLVVDLEIEGVALHLSRPQA
jgi:hypothetical protein